MPEYAIRVFSQTSDILSEGISAFDIKSHEDAREKGPFCDSDHQLMYWKNWGKRKDGKYIKKHFSHYSDRNRPIKNFIKIIDEQIKDNLERKSETPHKKFQLLLLEIIRQKISEGSRVDWVFKDKDSADFPLKGNLLEHALTAEKEYRIHPPFANYYDLDIAIIGKDQQGNDIVLAGIEIEYSHKAELLKTLLCKSLGFPLLTINIFEIETESITEELCLKMLTETTISSGDKRRRNYIYLHPLLYPVFLSEYMEWSRKINEKHQYIIFPKIDDVDRLNKDINSLIANYDLSNDVHCAPVRLNPDNQGSVTQFKNETSLFTNYIDKYSENCFLRLQASRPVESKGALYKFHIALSQLLALDYDCLVSYKYKKGQGNWNHEEQYWYIEKFTPSPTGKGMGTLEKRKLCFKRLSVPIRLIMQFLPQGQRDPI